MSYFRPSNLADAVAWLAKNDAQIAAGCTDLFPATDGPVLCRPTLDLTAIKSLRGIRDEGDHWHIGATTTWTDLLRAELPPAFDGLKAAAREVGSVQIQNTGTIAGNICNASPAADGIPPLLTLDAAVELTSANGSRTLSLPSFLLGPGKIELSAGEIVSAISIPKSAVEGRSSFLKLGARKYLVISISMVAARVVERAGRITDIALAVGACSPVARRLTSVERFLVGKEATAALTPELSDAIVAQHLAPIDDVRADRGYRLTAAAELVRRTLGALLDDKEKPEP